MTDKPKKLSDTVRALLTSAAARNDHLIHLPRLPMAAARQVIRSLLNAGLAEEVSAPIDDVNYALRTGEDGDVLMLRATMLGLAGVAATKDLRQSRFRAEQWSRLRANGWQPSEPMQRVR